MEELFKQANWSNLAVLGVAIGVMVGWIKLAHWLSKRIAGW